MRERSRLRSTRLSFRDDHRGTIGTLHCRTMLRRRRQACAACAGNRLYRFAFIFIPPATLLCNHHLTLSTLNLTDEYQRVTCDQTRTKALRQEYSRRRTQRMPVQEPRPEWHQGNISYGLHAMPDETITLQYLHCHSISGLTLLPFSGPAGRIAVMTPGTGLPDQWYMTPPNRLCPPSRHHTYSRALVCNS